MLRFFEEYCNQIFPSVDTEVQNAVRTAIKQINMDNKNWFMPKLLPDLSQGDILSELPFTIQKEDGSTETYMTKGMILSNTCDLVRDDYIMIAPLYDISKGPFEEKQIKDLKDNVFSGKMCFKNSELDNYFADFSQSTTFNRKLILEAMNRDFVKREESLTQFAWYLLLIKLTVYYMRVENHEWFESRIKGI